MPLRQDPPFSRCKVHFAGDICRVAGITLNDGCALWLFGPGALLASSKLYLDAPLVFPTPSTGYTGHRVHRCRAVSERCPSGELQRWTLGFWQFHGIPREQPARKKSEEGVDLKKVGSLCACNTQGLHGSTMYGVGTLKGQYSRAYMGPHCIGRRPYRGGSPGPTWVHGLGRGAFWAGFWGFWRSPAATEGDTGNVRVPFMLPCVPNAVGGLENAGIFIGIWKKSSFC